MNAKRREWSQRQLMAWLRLFLAIILGAIYFARPHDITFQNHQDAWGMVCGVFAVYFGVRSIIYFLLAPATFFLWQNLLAFTRREKPQYPCPICGYDIRMTPHRCPECGTKLRWGQLP